MINGEDTDKQIVNTLGYKKPRVKIVKLHGDLNARIFAFTPEEIFEFSDKIKAVLERYLSQDIIIVGHSMRDNDINQCIHREGGSIWYVNPDKPKINEPIGQMMRVRRSESNVISGDNGYFDRFFKALHNELEQAV